MAISDAEFWQEQFESLKSKVETTQREKMREEILSAAKPLVLNTMSLLTEAVDSLRSELRRAETTKATTADLVTQVALAHARNELAEEEGEEEIYKLERELRIAQLQSQISLAKAKKPKKPKKPKKVTNRKWVTRNDATPVDDSWYPCANTLDDQ